MRLKEVLNLEFVKNGVNSNLISDKEISDKVCEYLIELAENNDGICTKITSLGLDYTVEVALYKGEETKKHLIDIRAFDNVDDSMINAYLEVINDKLEPSDEYIDDVWSYDNWEVI